MVSMPIEYLRGLKWWGQRRPTDLPTVVSSYLDAPLPERSTPWRDVPYSVLDIETTGLNARRDSMLSIGMVDIDEGRVQLDRCWYTLLHPGDDVQVPAESIRIHGLFHQDMVSARPIEDVLFELLERLRGRVLVVHFARIDVDFLDAAFRKLWGVPLHGPAIDTMRLAQMIQHNDRWLTGHDGENVVTALEPLARQAGVPVHHQHHALGDAITTAQLFLAQAVRLAGYTDGRLRDLLKAGACRN